MDKNPYADLPTTAFWRTGVAEAGPFSLECLWKSKWCLPSDVRFSTFGSCFAQHVSRALVDLGLNWTETEPAPGRTPPELARKYNYGVFTARTGNIYTAAQLLTWARLSSGEKPADEIEIWADGAGRFFDSLRPRIEPEGFESEEEARASMTTASRAFRRSYLETDVFIFTLGLTEGWEDVATGQVWPMCPGTAVGEFNPSRHVFVNYGFRQTFADLEAAMAIMLEANPSLRFLFTVSPVPLVATASGDHVLTATTYSKSVLRAVAGELAASRAEVDYFPSYEIVASHPSRAMFFNPNLRSVEPEGVALVMKYFFEGLDRSGPPSGVAADGSEAQKVAKFQAESVKEDLVCEEVILEHFNVG